MELPVYQPIDCSYHDILLAKATLRKVCTIVYLVEGDQKQEEAVIKDVYTKNKEEFMLLSTGTIIRLDRIISVDEDDLPEESKCKI